MRRAVVLAGAVSAGRARGARGGNASAFATATREPGLTPGSDMGEVGVDQLGDGRNGSRFGCSARPPRGRRPRLCHAGSAS